MLNLIFLYFNIKTAAQTALKTKLIYKKITPAGRLILKELSFGVKGF